MTEEMSDWTRSYNNDMTEEQSIQLMGCVLQTQAPELYDWQEDHCGKLVASLKKNGAAKDGSDTGTGKTVVALECAKRLCRVPFVVAPKAVLPMWREWCGKFFPLNDEPFVFNYEKLRKGNNPYVFKNRGYLRWRLNPEKLLLIFDEVHRCKGDKSLNSKLLISAKAQGIPTLMLSATACVNPIEMKALGYVLGLHDLKGWWRWCLQHGCKKGFFGGLDFNNRREHLQYLHDALYKEKGSRIRIKDLGDKFPETLITADSYEVAEPGQIDVLYEEMESEMTQLKDTMSEDEYSPLVEQLRARQEVELMKVPTFVELARDAREAHNSVVIFVSFRQTLEAISDRLVDDVCRSTDGATLPRGIVTIHGDQSDEERAEVINLFQSNEAQVCVCMIQAGGTGLSLHDETGKWPRISLISPTFSAIELRQALGRVHRANGKSKSIQKIIFAANTVEDRVASAVRRKLDNLDMINDGELTPF